MWIGTAGFKEGAASVFRAEQVIPESRLIRLPYTKLQLLSHENRFDTDSSGTGGKPLDAYLRNLLHGAESFLRS